MLNKTYSYSYKLPKNFDYDYEFLFTGFESQNGDLIYRNDVTGKSNELKWKFNSTSKPDKLILWPFKNHWKEKVFVDVKDLKIDTTVDIPSPSRRKLSIFNKLVTCVIIDENHEKEVSQLVLYYKKLGIEKIIVINSKRFKIKPINSLNDYSEFVLKELHNYINTEFCLISQWDGFICNFNSFDHNFYDYDFIGAEWWWLKNTISGNGGFSLRSKKFLKVSSEIFNNKLIEKNEDELIEENIEEFKKREIVFAPNNIKNKFSVESGIYTDQFGFHCFTTQNLPNYCRYHYKNKFHHSGDLGDIIYSLPIIKELGGGCLILTADYDKMEIRDPMTEEKALMLKELLSDQDYITYVGHAPKKPSDIDYDLNDSRIDFIKWGSGEFSHEEIEILRNRLLTEHYERFYNLNYTYINQFYYPKSLIKIIDYPIIVNRTFRYRNDKFPWNEIVKKYGDKIMFVGSDKEYEDFVKNFGYVKYKNTPTYKKLMQVIAGAKLFIGNQSFPYSIAESIKQNCIQETDTWVGNCQYTRHNAFISKNGENYKFSEISKFIDHYV